MKKRIVAFVLACSMVLGLTACGGSSKAVQGTGTATGHNGGDIAVTVTIEDGVITKCVVNAENETKGLGDTAAEKTAEAIVANNSLAVDTISGATISSAATLEAAAAAITAAGLNPEDFMTAVGGGDVADVVKDADIVIIGAGGAGMTAAIVAADAGKTVVIIESQALVGGNSVRATGGLNAAETEEQDSNTFGEKAGVEKTLDSAKAYSDDPVITALAATVAQQWADYQANPVGYFDSTELMQLDTLIGGKGVNNAELVEVLCENSDEAIAWLESIGAAMPSVGSFGGASVKRIHRPVNAEGKTVSVGSYMIPVLEEACTSRGVEFIFNTTATTLLTDDNGAVVGVVGTGANGETVTVNAGAVILATGGFGANLEMVVEYKPELEGFMTTNAPGAQGQGIAMAVAVGAATVDMEQIQIHPTVQADTSALITEGLRGDGAILVNAEGKRFVDEVGTRDVVSAAEIAQTGSYSWLIVDQEMLDSSAVIQGYVTKGFTFTGATAEELAEQIGVPADVLAATLSTWNGYVENKNDPEFGRTSFASTLEGPYYAVKVTAGVHHTMGGLAINAETEVLDTNGNVIPGLYAAGEVTGGVHGANRLGGNAVADFTVFGRIAGESAAAYVG